MQDVSLDALELLTVADVARLMKVSKPTVWRLVGSGEIEPPPRPASLRARTPRSW
jgi:hypothetical protein